MESFPDLVKRYRVPEYIPSDDIGELLYVPAARKDLTNRMNLDHRSLLASTLGQEVRRRSKRDLYFLTRFMLWETNPAGAGRPLSDNKITYAEYKPIFDLFVTKDETKSLPKQDEEYKTRLVLWPRSGMKSTIDVCDSVQWILNFPDIRILYLTAADDLAIGLVDETKGHFVIKPEPSLMNIFFPEFCVDEKNMGNQFEFNCPLWLAKKLKRKEPTILAASVGGTKSGWHFEVIKADDAVSDKNSETPDQCITISRKINLARKLLTAGGHYIDYCGTRYDDMDHYGAMLEKNVGDVVTIANTDNLSLTGNKTTGTKILIARGIVIKPEVADQLLKDGRKVTYKEAGEEGCSLLIPTVMPYGWLINEWGNDESIFEAQINQNPTPPAAVTFDQPLLSRATVPYTDPSVPQTGPISITWDFAFSFNKKKKGRDFSAGCVVRWDREGRGFVIDIVRERYNTPESLAKGIVDLAAKWRPYIIGIEEATGSRLIEPTVKFYAQQTRDIQLMQVCDRIDWVTPENMVEAKRMRMAALQPWLATGRIKFISHLVHLQTLYTEFKKCLTSKAHDDIPDVISRQLKYAVQMSNTLPIPGGISPALRQHMNYFDIKVAEYNLLYNEDADCFGRIGMAGPRPMPIVDLVPETEVRAEAPEGLDPILGSGLYG